MNSLIETAKSIILNESAENMAIVKAISSEIKRIERDLNSAGRSHKMKFKISSPDVSDDTIEYEIESPSIDTSMLEIRMEKNKTILYVFGPDGDDQAFEDVIRKGIGVVTADDITKVLKSWKARDLKLFVDNLADDDEDYQSRRAKRDQKSAAANRDPWQ